MMEDESDEVWLDWPMTASRGDRAEKYLHGAPAEVDSDELPDV